MQQENFFFIEQLSPLYQAVQSSEIFADSKFFVDAVPKFAAQIIVANYNAEKDTAGFSLKKFIEQHFMLPEENSTTYSSAKKNIDTHLNDLWTELKRTPGSSGGTLIPLPHNYIVPGGRFREIYYWDSYFTMLGLQVSGKIDVIENMVNNFAYLINEFGFIPNGNRTYYLSRSQPPFFALTVHLLSEEKGEAVLLQYKTALEKEYQFWMKGADELTIANNAINHVVLLPDGAVLNRYWDDKTTPRPEAYIEDVHIAAEKNNAAEIYRHIRAAAASGWDFSSRWFADYENMYTIQTTNIIPVDLNCLLLFIEKLLQKMYTLANEVMNADVFAGKIQLRKKAIQQYCWNETEGFFFDYNFETERQQLHFSLAALFPLFFNMASNEQAAAVAKIIEQKFLQPGGVVTTLYQTGQQWDAPNGWAPLQWITYKGLKNYRFNDVADTLKNNWLLNCQKVYTATGKMMEKYNVMDIDLTAGGGEYPNQDGFGWTNGVYLKMKAD